MSATDPKVLFENDRLRIVEDLASDSKLATLECRIADQLGMRTVTIVSVWEAESEVELTDEQYADLIANGEFPDAAYDELDHQNARLLDWERKPEPEGD